MSRSTLLRRFRRTAVLAAFQVEPWRRTALAGGPVFAAALAWGLWLVRHRGGIDPDMAASYGSYFEPLKQAGLRAFWPSLRDLPRPLGDLTLSWLPGPPGLHYLLGGAALP